MNNYEHYVRDRKFERGRIMELFQRRRYRFETQTSMPDQYYAGAVTMLEFIMGPAYESLEWEKGDVVKIVGTSDRAGEIGVVRTVNFTDKKTVSIVTSKGDEIRVFGGSLQRVDIPKDFMEAARLKLEAEGYAKIKD